jgi:AhpD family alkylhydroperoxidase
MERITPVNPQAAQGRAKELLDAVKAKLGVVPNMTRSMAVSPSVLDAYLGFSSALAHGVLPARVREQLALDVGEANHCDYCVSAHSALGKRAGLVEDADLAAVREAGYGDAEIAEVVAHVALNIFTNYFNNVAGTTIDFPKAPALSA